MPVNIRPAGEGIPCLATIVQSLRDKGFGQNRFLSEPGIKLLELQKMLDSPPVID